jgi:hypothetical protein
MNTYIFDQLKVPRELTFEFLGTFARFEYALKRGGYLLGNDKKVKADWARFGRELAKLDDVELKPTFDSAKYLQETNSS